jgi:chaperonin cofactor prefoldin
MDLVASTRGKRQLLAVLLALLLGSQLTSGCSSAGAAAGATATADHHQAVAAYDDALKPLKARSDVLEERFAAVQRTDRGDPEQLREVLGEIIPAYAELLDEARHIKVEDASVKVAHEALLASLEEQQKGLELALRALEENDSGLMTKAGTSLGRARALLLKHRRLLSRARG